MTKLETVRVPPQFAADFERAEELVRSYFAERLDDPRRGTIEISGERYVLVRAAALSVEFFDLVEKLYGPEREEEAQSFARNILFDLAHSIGKSDAKNFHEKMGLLDPVAQLSAGPVHFAYSGWAFVDIDEVSSPTADEDYLLVYDHPYSFESDAWTKSGRRADIPVCIMNAGYSSGWCEESFGLSLVASEVLCRGRGDERCRFVMAPPERIQARLEEVLADEPVVATRVRSYEIPDFFARKAIEEELRATRDELEQRVAARTRDLERANERLRHQMEERERILTRVQNTQRLESLGRLAGGVAHDFNNLLGVIMGYSSLLERRVGTEDPMRPMLSEITEAAQLAAHLTRQLLTFSRGRVVVLRRIDLHEVVTNTSNMLNRLVGDDVRVVTRLAPGPAVVEADPTQIEQMLMNLAVNARDAMPEGGLLRIETALVVGGVDIGGESDGTGPANYVRLSVIDDGLGMDEELRSKIFEPFFSTKEGGDATGLGLSTVYGIVTHARGTIDVESVPGDGTRFDITLPLAEGVPLPMGAEAGGEDGASGGAPRRETVLLVEDRVSLRALLAEALSEDGYEVLVAHDSRDAIRITEQHPGPIDVLVADVVMPEVGGWELATVVAKERPGVRVLFMSGFSAGVPELDESHAEVATGFIAKPFTPLELREALHGLIHGEKDPLQ
jgi:signal transduction histidine kinase